MTPSEAVNAIVDAWEAGWDESNARTYFLWDALPNPEPVHNRAWCRLTVQHTATVQATLNSSTSGAKRWDREGMVTVQIFAPVSGGSPQLAALALAELAREILEGRSLPGNLVLFAAQITEVGTDSVWWQVNVNVQFLYQETR